MIDVTVRVRNKELQTSVELGTPSTSNMDSVAEKELTKVGEMGYLKGPDNDVAKKEEVQKMSEMGNPMKVGEHFTHSRALEPD